MAIRIAGPLQPQQYQSLQAPAAERPKSFLESAPGQQLVGKASGAALNKAGAGLGKAATLGANSLAQGSFAPGLGAALGGSTTGATLGSTLAGAGGTLGSTLGGLGTALGGAGLAGAATAAAPFVLGGAALGKAFGLFNRGTADVPMMDYGTDPLGLEEGTPMVQGYAGGTTSAKVSKLYNEGYTAPGQAYAIAKDMGYQRGTDSVPAMLTPGEAVIPAESAQDPENKPMIAAMIDEGRAEQDGMGEMTVMSAPLSKKTEREEMKLLQEMSLKKKSWMMDEQRKQDAHDQKMKMSWMKAAQSMQE